MIKLVKKNEVFFAIISCIEIYPEWKQSKEKMIMCVKMLNGILLIILKHYNVVQMYINEERLSQLYFNLMK